MGEVYPCFPKLSWVLFYSFDMMRIKTQCKQKGTEGEMTMWNTGCNFIANDTLKSIFILDQEDTRYSLVVPSQKIATFKGVIFPWCNRTEEILHKAFRVYEGESEKGDLLFYIFQNYNDNMVYFSREADWNKISLCADEPASYLNVLINRDRKPVCSIG